jgi:4-amino-4-deoxy-L-arabinose transferase-like glycosyltransferase
MPFRVAQLLTASVLIWAALVVVGLVVRPPLPIDETRYLAVAWEMWRGGDYLVPHLNGIEYHHKPPLLFWIMTLGWRVFGVSETWARLVAPLFALGTLFLTLRLGRMLFPNTLRVAGIAPLALIGTVLFTLFASLTFFDTLVTFFTVLGLIGVAHAADGRLLRGWITVAIALGLGILSKGPVQLLDIAAVPLLAPLWLEDRPTSWPRWYGGFLLAVLGGAGIALAWAVPAAYAGGPEFAYMLFLGQTTQRVVEAMWHERPWWWYVPASFVFAFPWLCWPSFWGSLFIRRAWNETGVRFCLSMLIPLFIAFSAISGKQPHYLLPMLPVFALLMARFAVAGNFSDGRLWRLPPLLILFVPAVALIALALDPSRFARIHDALLTLPPVGVVGLGAAILVAVMIVAVAFDQPRPAGARIGTFSLLIAALVIAIHIALLSGLRPRYDATGIGAVLARAEADGKPIAHVYDYHGQFHFAGRLRKPIDVIDEDGAGDWSRAHPDGLVIDYRDDAPATYPAQPLYSQPWRGRYANIWPAAAIATFGKELLTDRPR